MFATAFAQSAPAASSPGYQHFRARQMNQSRRINQGLRSGSLSRSQAGQLRRGDRGIAAQARAEKRAQGGTLSQAQRSQVHQEMNQESRRIYNEKH